MFGKVVGALLCIREMWLSTCTYPSSCWTAQNLPSDQSLTHLFFQEEEKGRLPARLGCLQSNIIASMGRPGRTNGVVLIVAPTYQGSIPAGGASGHLFYVPGTAMAVRQRLIAVLTAQHALARCIQKARKMHKGPVQVWAMPAGRFGTLDQGQKQNLTLLRKEGAVLAKGYHSLLKGRDPEVYAGLNLAIVDLVGPLPSMHATQPCILSNDELQNVIAYFRDRDYGARVHIMVEGMGSHTSYSSGGRQRGIPEVCQTLSVDGPCVYFSRQVRESLLSASHQTRATSDQESNVLIALEYVAIRHLGMERKSGSLFLLRPGW
jgi:hypothetical protein